MSVLSRILDGLQVTSGDRGPATPPPINRRGGEGSGKGAGVVDVKKNSFLIL